VRADVFRRTGGKKVEKNKKRHPVGQYFLGLALAADQALSALRGWDHDETVSSMLGKMERYYGKDFKRRRWFAFQLSKVLNRIEQMHCFEAIEDDEGENAVADKHIARGGK
jgi:hypothetical protein